MNISSLDEKTGCGSMNLWFLVAREMLTCALLLHSTRQLKYAYKSLKIQIHDEVFFEKSGSTMLPSNSGRITRLNKNTMKVLPSEICF